MSKKIYAGEEADAGYADMSDDRYKCLKLENQLCFPLYACSKEVIRKYKPLLDRLDLTYTQYIAMMVLWEKERASVGQLGETLHLDAGTLTPLLKRLEKAGYVTRERSKEDERITIIAITPEGDALKEECKDIPIKMASGKMPLSGEEAEELYRLLYKFLESE